MRRLLLTLAMVAAILPGALGSDAAVQEAVVAMQRQDYSGAEQKLRTELKLHPNDAETLSLLGVALDEQKKFLDADGFHKKAIASAPRSAAALYNYANHLLATGDEKAARQALLKSIAIDPADRNANLALAQLALNAKAGTEALAYLDKLKDVPETAIMRLTALDLAGDPTEAGTLFDQLAAATQNNGKLSAEYGWELENAGQFDQAETFLTHAMAADPANPQILYDLGVTASRAGHNEKAREVLETALRQQPKNVDAQYALALVYNSLAQPEPAIRLLAEAGQLAPQRADVQKLLAIAARNMGADEDSAAAWDRYLKLVPNDDDARRERAFARARAALLDDALPELKAYVARHPDDPIGFYELGMAQSVDDPAAGISNLNRAISLKPDFVAARGGRGIVLYTQDQPEAAIPDLEFAVRQIPRGAPESAGMLDRLGQAYAALNRLSDAVPILRKAIELAPDDSTIVLHLANALAEAGQTAESDALMARFRDMRPGGRAPKVSGVVDYLSMTPEGRRDLYRTRVEKEVHDHPDDVNSQLLYIKLLLTDNRMPDASAAAQKFAALKPGAAALAEAGHALLAARQYPAAKEVLEQAVKADPSLSARSDLGLDVVNAEFHAAGPDARAAGEGLRQLDRLPESSRDAGYYVARAQMLDITGKAADAVVAMDGAIRASPGDINIYWQAAALMAKNNRAEDALRVLDQASKTLRPSAESEALVSAIRAGVLEMAGRTDDARRLLSDAQIRAPEVAALWAAQGIILAAHQSSGGGADEARKALETAVALGAHSPETWYALAEATFHSAPERRDTAETAIKQAVKLAPDDVQARALAARIIDPKVAPPATKNAAPSRSENVDPSKLFLTRPPAEW